MTKSLDSHKLVFTMATLKGVIRPFERDRKGHIIAISVSKSGQDCIIANTGLGLELFNFIDEPVLVTGEVLEDERGNRVVTVLNYSLLAEDTS